MASAPVSILLLRRRGVAGGQGPARIIASRRSALFMPERAARSFRLCMVNGTTRSGSSERGEASSLAARLQRGESSAYEELVRTQGSRLLRVARRMMRNEEDARDAVQDAFIAAFKSVGKFNEQSSLATWLHRIVINACLMKLRSQRRKPEEDIEPYLPKFQEDGHQVQPSIQWSESAETLLERNELCSVVRSSIDQLPDSYRLVLLLREIEEMSTEETAEVLGVSANAVKVRLHRARQALRTLLDPHMRAGAK